MQYLIDGYNLLHAMGRLQARTGLEKARQRLLSLLHGAFGNESASVTVVFDAADPPAGATEVQDYRGIQVRFAVYQDQTDDLIELIIQRDSAPRQLTVVSDDHRLQKAGRRRHCPVMGCGIPGMARAPANSGPDSAAASPGQTEKPLPRGNRTLAARICRPGKRTRL